MTHTRLRFNTYSFRQNYATIGRNELTSYRGMLVSEGG
jgi:hypothetical protein